MVRDWVSDEVASGRWSWSNESSAQPAASLPRVSRRRRRTFVGDQSAKHLPELATGAMKPAADGPDRNIQQRGNFFVSMLLQVFQEDDGTMFGRQRRQRLEDLLFTLAAIKRGARVGLSTGVNRVRGAVGKALMTAKSGRTRSPSATSADGEIDRDPVNPRVEGACSLKLVELDVSTNERILKDVARILLGAKEPQDRRVEAVLMTPDERAEGFGTALATSLNQFVIVQRFGHQ